MSYSKTFEAIIATLEEIAEEFGNLGYKTLSFAASFGT